MKALAPDYIWQLEPYVPGETIPQTIKLASNENAFGPSLLAVRAAEQALSQVHMYPLLERSDLKKRLVQHHVKHSIQMDQIVLGPGSTELITLLVRTLVAPGEVVLNAWPSFLMYSLAARSAGREEIRVSLTSELEYDIEALSAAFNKNPAIKIFFLANPNNPTGTYVGVEALERLLQSIPNDVVVVIDEAYVEYVTAMDYPQALRLLTKRPRTVVLRTFSKAYGLAGLRIAYAVCDAEIASLLQRVKEPFNVSSIAQAAALAALDDHEHLQASIQNNASEMDRLLPEFKKLGIAVTPSQANFVLAHFSDAKYVHKSLIERGVVTRPVANYGLMNALRITIGKPSENEALLRGLYSLKLR